VRVHTSGLSRPPFLSTIIRVSLPFNAIPSSSPNHAKSQRHLDAYAERFTRLDLVIPSSRTIITVPTTYRLRVIAEPHTNSFEGVYLLSLPNCMRTRSRGCISCHYRTACELVSRGRITSSLHYSLAITPICNCWSTCTRSCGGCCYLYR
jgi:hypothetical protein